MSSRIIKSSTTRLPKPGGGGGCGGGGMTSSNVWFVDDGIYVKAEVSLHTIDGDATRCQVKTDAGASHTVLREALFPREVLTAGQGVDQLTSLRFPYSHPPSPGTPSAFHNSRAGH